MHSEMYLEIQSILQLLVASNKEQGGKQRLRQYVNSW